MTGDAFVALFKPADEGLELHPLISTKLGRNTDMARRNGHEMERGEPVGPAVGHEYPVLALPDLAGARRLSSDLLEELLDLVAEALASD